MKWKTGVTVKKENTVYMLQREQQRKPIHDIDNYIVRAMEKGIHKDDDLVGVVMKKESCTQVVASLRLAQFVLEYSEYISDDIGHMIIEP